MNVLSFVRPTEISNAPEDRFVVIHPLDDVREVKVETSNLGRMPMKASVRLSLMALRGYLFLMVLLVLYHILDLAGLFGTHSVS